VWIFFNIAKKSNFFIRTDQGAIGHGQVFFPAVRKESVFFFEQRGPIFFGVKIQDFQTNSTWVLVLLSKLCK